MRSVNRRKLLAAVLALLALTAMPVTVVNASSQYDVASKNTTDTDFEAANTLDNVSIEGTGDSASVALKTRGLIDGFEDNDTAEYTHNTGSYTTQSAVVRNGSYALSFESGTTEHITSYSGLANYPDQGDTFRWSGRLNGSNFILFGFGAQSGTGSSSASPDGYYAYIDKANDKLKIRKKEAGSSTTIASTNITWQTNKWYDIRVDWASDGTITVTALDTSGTQLAETNATDTTYTSGGIVWQANGGMYGDYAFVERPSASGQYVSQNHTASDLKDGFTNLTLQNSTATVEWLADTNGDGTFETTANTSTFSSSGNHTLDVSGTDADAWRVNVTFDSSSGETTAELHDEGLLFDNSAPGVDNSSATPSGGETASETPITLSIDVSDEDFGTSQGDNVTVTFYDASDDSQLGSETLSSNGTASTSWTPPGGEQQWYVIAEDEYGGTTTSDTFTFKAPDKLFIRNESDPDSLVDQATVEVTFFASDKVVERSTTNGTIDLSGLPTDEKIVVVADATDYYSRHIILDNIYTQNSVYLLNSTETAVDVTFTNADETGEWPPETTEVIVEKGLTQNNSTTYRTLAADEFGVSGFSTTLAKDERYRIKVRNARGDVRILGSHTSSQDETVPLRPVPTGIELNESKPYNGIAYYENVSINGGYEERIVFEYEDEANGTTDLVINIHEQGNKSNTLGSETTIAGPLGSAIVSEVMTDEQANKTWVVNWEAQRDGETIGGQIIVGATIDEQVSELDPWVREAIAVLVVIMTAALFSQLNRGVGAVSTSLVGGGFWYTGWLPAEAGGAIGLALGVAVAYKIARGQEGQR